VLIAATLALCALSAQARAGTEPPRFDDPAPNGCNTGSFERKPSDP
jgi:hypothetical protein